MVNSNAHRSRVRLGCIPRWKFVVLLIALGWSGFNLSAAAPSALLGDLDGDGRLTALDLVILNNYLTGINTLSTNQIPFADLNQDGVIDASDVAVLANMILGLTPLRELPLAHLVSSSPHDGDTEVAVLRETIFRFSVPLADSTVLTTNNFYAGSSGQRLLTRIELSSDRRVVTLFYLEPMPGSTRINVVFNGDGVTDYLGRPLDPDGDTVAGGLAVVGFDTLNLTALPGTAVIGRVFASELMPGPGNTNSVNRPLQGVTITVDGKEESLRAVTDVNGNFKLSPAPPGKFFVKIDGRTAVGGQWPQGNYYPYVGKQWEAVAGREDNLAGGTGEIYLPLIVQGTLQPVSPVTNTVIHFPPSIISSNPAFSEVSITVPPNSLFSDDGTRGGKVGIAPVPSNRLPGPLPPGLELPIVITVQTDGPLNFDKPAPVCFPNVPDPVTGQPLPPGSKQALLSFNHKKGFWEAVGTMTVTADGKYVCSDPGMGIVQPGWHGVGPPPNSPPPPPPPPPPPCPPGKDNSADLAKCLKRCQEDGDRHLAYCTAAGAAGIIVCVLAGPGAPLCIAGVVAAAAICDAGVVHDTLVCYDRCNEDFPPCTPPGPGLARLQSLTGLAAAGSTGDIPPFPNDPIAGQIADLYHQITVLTYPYAMAGQTFPPNVASQMNNLIAQANAVAGGDAAQYMRDAVLAMEEAEAPLEAQIGENKGNAPAYPVKYMAEIQRANGEIMRLRGDTGPFGQYLIFVPRDGTLRYVSFYDRQTKSYGIVFPRLRPQAPYRLPRFTLTPVDSSFPDTDHDGLPDVVEFIYGTDPNNPDTGGKGITDGAAVDQGLNPLGGFSATIGVIATVQTPGSAVDIAVLNDVAAVAEMGNGVSLFNVFNGMNPTITAQVATPGNARAVACASSFVAVAADSAGLVVLDISQPAAAHVSQQVNVGGVARTVAASGNVAFVGLENGRLLAVDMPSGTIVDQVQLDGPVHSLAVSGNTVYALRPGKLFAMDFEDNLFTMGGSVNAPGSVGAGGRPLRLFAGGGLAYETFTSGYNVFYLNDPLHPSLGTTIPSTQFGWRDFVSNGSGLGVAVVGNNSTTDGSHDISLFDLRPVGTTSIYLTTIPLPASAEAAVIYNGMAYVADGTAGLQVVNYLPYDSQHVPPTITLSADFPQTGAQAEKWVNVMAQATDDVQVRNVQFYLDGVKVLTDGSFPFEFSFLTPALTPAKTSFRLRALATDTGGNSTWSDEWVVPLLKNTTPPRLVHGAPWKGEIVGAANSVTANFNKSMNAATFNANTFTLTFAGTDNQLGTADDVVVTSGQISYNDNLRAAVMSFANNVQPGLYKVVVSPPIADTNGNTLARSYSWQFHVNGLQDTDHDGIPDDIEIKLGLNPNKADSRGDGILDGDRDLNGDGLTVRWKLAYGYDPVKRDSFGDGIPDAQRDPDFDGLTNLQEQKYGTNPFNADTDGDGFDDGTEILEGTDPLDPFSKPRIVQIIESPNIAFLNALNETVPTSVTLTVLSQPVSYLNALAETVPATVTISVNSLLVSYLNSLAEQIPSAVSVSVFSPLASYLNAVAEAAVNYFVVSPLVSYQNKSAVAAKYKSTPQEKVELEKRSYHENSN